MHDLNTINRLNNEALDKAVRNFQAQGRTVVVRRDGLAITSFETFSTLEAAKLALEGRPANKLQGESADILLPLPGFAAAQRDQSEDRPSSQTVEALTAYGASSPARADITLGDYINRKT